MARTYKRDSRGRFAGGGGGGGGRKGGGAKKGGRLGGKSSGPKMGAGRPGTSAPGGTVAKSAVNRSIGSVMGQGKGTRVKAKAAPSAFGGKMGKATVGRKAQAKYKAAARKAREVQSAFTPEFRSQLGPKAAKSASRQLAGAKAGLTKVTKGLRGGRAGNVGRTKADERRSGLQAYAGGLSKARAMVSARKAASKPSGMKSQVARGREAKAAYKAATSAAREAKMRAGGRTTTRGLSKRTDAGAKNIRANVKAFQAAQRKVKQMETKRKATRRRKA